MLFHASATLLVYSRQYVVVLQPLGSAIRTSMDVGCFRVVWLLRDLWYLFRVVLSYVGLYSRGSAGLRVQYGFFCAIRRFGRVSGAGRSP